MGKFMSKNLVPSVVRLLHYHTLHGTAPLPQFLYLGLSHLLMLSLNDVRVF